MMMPDAEQTPRLDERRPRASAPDYATLLAVVTEWMRAQNETNAVVQEALAHIDAGIEQLHARVTRIEDANQRWQDISPGNSLTQ